MSLAPGSLNESLPHKRKRLIETLMSLRAVVEPQ